MFEGMKMRAPFSDQKAALRRGNVHPDVRRALIHARPTGHGGFDGQLVQ